VSDYEKFLASKAISDQPTGLEDVPDLNPMMKPFQDAIVRWLLRRGKAALFADCGLGKTFMFLEWARRIFEATGSNCLILDPLSVADQTVKEGEKFGIEVRYCRSQSDVKPGLTVTNYEMLEHFDAKYFDAVVLDDSYILKAFMGKTKRLIIDSFRQARFKLACTATPAPNDHLELGNYADFLDIMPSNEMISRWFINDSMNVGHYRLKGHAEASFWEWVASWAVCIAKPSDIGFSDEGYILPPLNMHEVIVEVHDKGLCEPGSFLPRAALNATDIHRVMRRTAEARAIKAAELSSATPECFVHWCNTDYESDALCEAISGSVAIKGSESLNTKIEKLRAFKAGQIKDFISKAKITGFGLNWQHCHNTTLSPSYSFEQFYQSICRFYRFGQELTVNAWLIATDAEVGVVETQKRKREDHRRMQQAMIAAMREIEIQNMNPGMRKRLTNEAGAAPIQLSQWMVA
jgi:hypothetical protein